MKNSRRSDRELAKVVGISQPTVSRLLKKLRKEGYIKEFTMIPDFAKLGYEIMGITCIGVKETYDREAFEKIRSMTAEVEKANPHAALMAVNGINRNKDRVFITFYEDYAAFVKAMDLTRQLPFVKVESMENFLVNLKDKTNYRVLSMSEIAKHILKKNGKRKGASENS
jgi:DNA-binding Lrp family transcriptional regulator